MELDMYKWSPGNGGVHTKGNLTHYRNPIKVLKCRFLFTIQFMLKVLKLKDWNRNLDTVDRMSGVLVSSFPRWNATLSFSSVYLSSLPKNEVKYK